MKTRCNRVGSVWALFGTAALLVVLGTSPFTARSSLAAEDDRETDPEIRVMTLVNARAVEMARTLDALTETFGLRVSADGRTNSLVAVGRPDDLQLLEALVLRLDSDTAGSFDPPPEQAEPPAPFLSAMMEPGDWVLAVHHTGQNRYVVRVLSDEELKPSDPDRPDMRYQPNVYQVQTIGDDYLRLTSRRKELLLPAGSIREIYRTPEHAEVADDGVGD